MNRTLPSSPARPGHRLDPRAPLVLDTRELGRRPGSMRRLSRSVPAPAGLAVGTAAVPAGAPVRLELRLEAVMEGVLVSGTAAAPLAGECGRCLEPVHDEIEVDLQELFLYEPDPADEDLPVLAGDLVDLEPALRDALVLELPTTPLCADGCPGLCPRCGARLADEAGHHHNDVDPRWAALGALVGSADPTEQTTRQE